MESALSDWLALNLDLYMHFTVKLHSVWFGWTKFVIVINLQPVWWLSFHTNLLVPTAYGMGTRAPTFINGWARGGGTVSRGTANKKLTKLYWPSWKRSSKWLIVLLEPISGGARPKTNFSGALHRIGAPPILLWTDAPPPNFQIRSGATGYIHAKAACWESSLGSETVSNPVFSVA